ncbi:hypothetical protein CISG_08046 [Coccidioides immitis RMSCC 3703]|uniref:Uncharacterized protein n=2 Tax=Coccidioides immitis TaxID=5501 RepID=A0A0J8R4S7_COCIT|nr:hypothetical protein CIRG_07554 [Coccidioides immitis RMSCC 2394]KMU79766.1 hypothetical protein CISG_08046 [Coccidioides immitis RMSCC 3703]
MPWIAIKVRRRASQDVPESASTLPTTPELPFLWGQMLWASKRPQIAIRRSPQARMGYKGEKSKAASRKVHCSRFQMWLVKRHFPHSRRLSSLPYQKRNARNLAFQVAFQTSSSSSSKRPLLRLGALFASLFLRAVLCLKISPSSNHLSRAHLPAHTTPSNLPHSRYANSYFPPFL